MPPIVVGALLYPEERGIEVFEGICDIVTASPRTLSVRLASALPSPIAALGEQRVVGVKVIYQGAPDDAALNDLRRFGDPILDTVTESSYLALQTEFDEFSQHGIGWYMKSGHTRTVSREALAAGIEAAHSYRDVASAKVDRSVHSIASLGGAAADVDEMATAYSGREANWHFAIEVGFTTAEERERIVNDTRRSWAKIEPHLDMRTSYVNMLFEEQLASLERVYGVEKFAKLRHIKTVYDPTNVFRHNANIPPLDSVRSVGAA